MLITTLLFINATLFALLALVHFYWAIGGRLAYDKAVPSDNNGRPVFRPGPFGTAVVGTVLILFAFTDLAWLGWLTLVTDSKYIRYSLWAIATLFLLRGIGDFKYVGITKQRKKTSFARMDTIIYTPLCFFIGLSHILIGISYP